MAPRARNLDGVTPQNLIAGQPLLEQAPES
jgi:hypothetical protein